MSTYLITGGCGFLGSNLAQEVIQRGEHLIVFDNLSRPGSEKNLVWLREQGKFEFVHGDIRNAWDVECLVKRIKPEVIFHLAGQVAMTTSIANPRMDFEVNALGSVNVLEAVRKFVPEAAVIYSSTNKVYGGLEQYAYRETETRYECIDRPGGFDETTPLEFHSPYGCSKGAADQYMLDYGRIYGLNTVVFRHSSMYGGRQFATYDQGWVGWFCQKAIETKSGTLKEAFTISGTGKQVRDVLHVEDIKRLYFSVVGHIEQAKCQVFNVGGGIENSLSLLELFALLEDFVETKLKYIHLPARESDQLVFVASIGKVQQTLEWRPYIAVTEGVCGALEWIRDRV